MDRNSGKPPGRFRRVLAAYPSIACLGLSIYAIVFKDTEAFRVALDAFVYTSVGGGILYAASVTADDHSRRLKSDGN